MKRWGEIAAFIASIIAIYIFFDSTIDSKIDRRLKDPDFLKKVVEEVRLPFVIFDFNKSILVDTGAMKYIDKIELKRDEGQRISHIIISPKSFIAVPPILESLDDKEIEFEEPTRGSRFDLSYKTVLYATGFANTLADGSKPQRRLRLQFVVLPD